MYSGNMQGVPLSPTWMLMLTHDTRVFYSNSLQIQCWRYNKMVLWFKQHCSGVQGQAVQQLSMTADGTEAVQEWWTIDEKKKWGGMLVHYRILMASSRCFHASFKKSIHSFSLVSYPLRWEKKKKKGGRDCTRELQMLRRLFVGYGRASCYFLAELYLLFVMNWGLL